MKFMNLKRFASVAMAGALALSLTAPAFATNSTNITGTYRAITVNVVVPTTGQVVINPYGLPIDLGEETISGQQITTGAPLLVQNKSAVPLSVSASIVSAKKGNFVFDSNAIGTSETGNKGNVLFQMFEAPTVTETVAADTDQLNTLFAALKDEDALCSTVLTETNASANPAVPAVEELDIVTLRPADSNDNLVAGGAAFFRLSGTVAKKPTVAWTASDGFTAKITFTFEPTVMTASAGTIARDSGSGNLAASTNETADVTLTLGTGVPADLTWVWSSSDAAKVSVTANGTDSKKATVTAQAAGNATITATATGTDGTVYSATIDFTAA